MGRKVRTAGRPRRPPPKQLRTVVPKVADIVWAFADADILVAAICHGAKLLNRAGVLENREITGY